MQYISMSITIKENSDKPGIRQIIADHHALILKEREFTGLWTVDVPIEFSESLMDTLDANIGVHCTSYETKVEELTLTYKPTDTYYAASQKAIMEYVGVDLAWEIQRGNSSVGSYFIDYLVDGTHPDLSPNVTMHGISSVTDGEHGTMIAGNFAIHNGKGVAGIAGGCLIHSYLCNARSGVWGSQFANAVEDILANISTRPNFKSVNLSMGSNSGTMPWTYIDATHMLISGGVNNSYAYLVGYHTRVIDSGHVCFGTIIDYIYDSGANQSTFTISWDIMPVDIITTYTNIDETMWHHFERLYQAGILLFIAAGNSPIIPNKFFHSKAVIVAAADTTSSSLMSYSSRGQQITLAAPSADYVTFSLQPTVLCTQYLTQGAPLNQLSIKRTSDDGNPYHLVSSMAADYSFTGGRLWTSTGIPCSPEIRVLSVSALGPNNIVWVLDTPIPYVGSDGLNSDWAAAKLEYGTGGGTSFASPFAMAVADLLWCYDPTITPDAMKALLIATANRHGGFPAGPTGAGAGVVDAYKAMLELKRVHVRSTVANDTVTLVCDVGSTAVLPANIYYTTDGSTPTIASTVYTTPLLITDSIQLSYMATDSASTPSMSTVKTETITGVVVVDSPVLGSLLDEIVLIRNLEISGVLSNSSLSDSYFTGGCYPIESLDSLSLLLEPTTDLAGGIFPTMELESNSLLESVNINLRGGLLAVEVLNTAAILENNNLVFNHGILHTEDSIAISVLQSSILQRVYSLKIADCTSTSTIAEAVIAEPFITISDLISVSFLNSFELPKSTISIRDIHGGSGGLPKDIYGGSLAIRVFHDNQWLLVT